MLKLKISTPFKKDFKKYKHHAVVKELDHVIKILVKEHSLPAKYQDHNLSGNWKGYRECHVKPDILLIYHIDLKKKLLTLVRFGSHSDLFG